MVAFIKLKLNMKQILFALLLLASISLSAQEGFKITGRLGGTLGGNLMLVTNTTEGAIRLGQAVMVNGNFSFSGKVNEMTPVYILTDQQQPIATLMLENTEYTILAGENGIEVEGGGEAQKLWNQYDAITQTVARESQKMEQEARTAYSSGKMTTASYAENSTQPLKFWNVSVSGR